MIARLLCLALALIAVSSFSAGCVYEGYERGTVRHLETSRRSEPGEVVGRVEWVDGDGWTKCYGGDGYSKLRRLAYFQRKRLDLPRRWFLVAGVDRTAGSVLSQRRVFNSILWEAHYHPAFIAFELLELITSPLYILLMPPLALGGVAPPETPHMTMGFVDRLMIGTAPLNPFVSIFGIEVKRTEVVDEDVFVEEPEDLSFTSRIPVRGGQVSYRLLAADGSEVGKGSGTTSDFGEVTIGVVGEGSAHWNVVLGAAPPPTLDPRKVVATVEITHDGHVERVAVPPAPKFERYPRMLDNLANAD